LAKQRILGETTLTRGGTTLVPESVIGTLGLKHEPGKRSKLLWTLRGDEAVVDKATPPSDWKKTMLRKNGTAAIPRHIQQSLNLKSQEGEKVLWLLRENQVIVRKRATT
jgi:hypothetical protein